ncbi:MAG: hypothetical protein AB1330_01515 [Bacillota bacterium]
MEGYRCPACYQADGFIEELTHCRVVRRVNGYLEHVETLDWDGTDETESVYYCVNCGGSFSAEVFGVGFEDGGNES